MSDESTPRVMSKGGPLVDHPGWWMVEVWKEDNPSDTRSFVRKEDGTYWDIAARDLFPRSGGILKITLAEEITEGKQLSICRDFYTHLKKKMDEGAR
jgi:hypothetical protein